MEESMKKEILAGWNSVQNQHEDDWLLIEVAMSKTKFYPDMGDAEAILHIKLDEFVTRKEDISDGQLLYIQPETVRLVRLPF